MTFYDELEIGAGNLTSNRRGLSEVMIQYERPGPLLG